MTQKRVWGSWACLVRQRQGWSDLVAAYKYLKVITKNPCHQLQMIQQGAMAIDFTLGNSGQTKGKPVGRCRGRFSPGWSHQWGFQDLAKQRHGCPDLVLGALLPQGESWIQSLSFTPKFSCLSVFPYWKAQVFWGTPAFLNTVASNLNQLFRVS